MYNKRLSETLREADQPEGPAHGCGGGQVPVKSSLPGPHLPLLRRVGRSRCMRYVQGRNEDFRPRAGYAIWLTGKLHSDFTAHDNETIFLTSGRMFGEGTRNLRKLRWETGRVTAVSVTASSRAQRRTPDRRVWAAPSVSPEIKGSNSTSPLLGHRSRGGWADVKNTGAHRAIRLVCPHLYLPP